MVPSPREVEADRSNFAPVGIDSSTSPERVVASMRASGMRSGRRVDVAALHGNFERIGKVAELHVFRVSGQSHRTHQAEAVRSPRAMRTWPGSFSMFRVGRLALEAQRLRQVAELQHARIGAVDGHLPVDASAGRHRRRGLSARTAPLTPVARTTSLRRRSMRASPPMFCSRTPALSELMSTLPATSVMSKSPIAAMRFNARALGDHDLHVGVEAHVPGGNAILIVANRDRIRVAVDLERRVSIGAIRAALIQAANGAMAGDLHRCRRPRR